MAKIRAHKSDAKLLATAAQMLQTKKITLHPNHTGRLPNLLAKGAQRKQPIASPRPVAEMRYESLLMPTPKSLSNWAKPVPNPVMQKLHNMERSRMEYNAAIFFFVDQFWRHC